ncbi:hypothetical protein DAI22_01g084100 [Oryza sativa Japonica Group]|nr:hypothetical protein DAI22_01g084100 [Oryza sativa Japonica Group]
MLCNLNESIGINLLYCLDDTLITHIIPNTSHTPCILHGHGSGHVNLINNLTHAHKLVKRAHTNL